MRIGSLEIHQPLALAPMEDVSETPFRLICKRLGADLLYTEFTSSEGLIREIPRTLKKVELSDEERPIAIQLFGGVETSLESAVKVCERFQPSFIDINCGCWVKNHVARGEGAALLKDLPHFEAIVKSVVKSTKLPVTVKTRLGWDHENIVILDVARMIEQAGAQALTVHCRTRSQAHRGFADWSWLEKIKKVISIPLIGNGDITTPQDVKQMLETGCDGVMIGRGAIANPWIFQQSKHYLKTAEFLPEATIQEKIQLCIEHLKLSIQYKGQRDGIITFRKFYAGYLHGLSNIAKLRSDLMNITDLQSILDRLDRFLEESSCLSPLIT